MTWYVVERVLLIGKLHDSLLHSKMLENVLFSWKSRWSVVQVESQSSLRSHVTFLASLFFYNLRSISERNSCHIMSSSSEASNAVAAGSAVSSLMVMASSM